MFMQRVASTYGRLVPKPEKDEKKTIDYIDEAPVPIQDQIENLRTKIALKERYNKVIAEDLEESRLGTSSVLQDLYTETRELRAQLIDALNAEKAAVQNALRTHRIYQLAMTNKKSTFAIPWLDDKMFDITKNFNGLLNYLGIKRKKLEEAEAMVVMIEKWPRPGSLPWEVDAEIEFQRLENNIENMRVKGETAAILHSKYYEVKFILREEAGRYIPTLRILENQLTTQSQELTGLKKMLREAVYFRDEAEKNLHLTERESSENHKERRKQMTKMKKAVEKLLAENANPMAKFVKGPTMAGSDDWTAQESSVVVTEGMLKHRKEKIEDFQDRVHRLVDAMRVSDLVQVPQRLKTVKFLGTQLRSELSTKETLRDVLLRQKSQLFLIQSHFRYTGQKQEELFVKRRDEYVAAIGNVKKDVEEANRRLQRYGNITVEIRLCVIAILNRIEEGRRRTKSRAAESDLRAQMKVLYSKVYKLVKQVRALQDMFQTADAERDYGVLLKPKAVQPRLLRVGSPAVSDDSDDDDLPDLKIPNRVDIKLKSQRFIQQAILRRGLK